MSIIRAKSMHGFTLFEAVIAIAISGIVVGIVAMLMRIPVQGYVDNVERTELIDTADNALRRMARDLRLALPNSIRTTSAGGKEYIEFLLTKTGGRYLAVADNPVVTGNELSFTNPAQTTFTIVGPAPTDSQAIVSGDFIVVYNLGAGMSPADAYANGCTNPGTSAAQPCNLAVVSSVAGNAVTLGVNTFASQPAPQFTSPGRHFHVVSSAVTYVCDPTSNTLKRFSGYAISAAQPTDLSSAPVSALLARDVKACGFFYDNAAGSFASQRSGLVGLTLTMEIAGSNSGAITLARQVYVDNTP